MELSVIIPAYNEENRILPFLKALQQSSKKFSDYELIFVNDGSTDGTLSILNGFSKKNKRIRIISYQHNRGKGYAVRKGIMNARGEKIIFIDSDGSINPGEIPKMSKALDRFDFVWGNRSNKGSKISQSSLRKITSSLFNPYVEFLFHNRIADNLCGFKGFRRDTAIFLFKRLRSTDWIFDVELFTLARRYNCRMSDLPISWSHMGGSKITLLAPLKMGFSLIGLKLRLK